jgi:hypothetical protein
VELLKTPRLREQQRLAARTLLEIHCGPASVLDRFERIYARFT